jgi:hypothetical protein
MCSSKHYADDDDWPIMIKGQDGDTGQQIRTGRLRGAERVAEER